MESAYFFSEFHIEFDYMDKLIKLNRYSFSLKNQRKIKKINAGIELETNQSSLLSKIDKCARNVLFNIKNKNKLLGFFVGYKKVTFKEASNPVMIWNYFFEPKIKGNKKIYKLFLEKIIWITYRNNFIPISKMRPEIIFPDQLISYTSDSGWGCAIRVGQMAVANGLLINYSNQNGVSINNISEFERQKIIKLFWDNGSGKEYIFSIQNICKVSSKFKKMPGEWFGFSEIAYIFCDLNNTFHSIENVKFVSFNDGIIIKKTILKIAIPKIQDEIQINQPSNKIFDLNSASDSLHPDQEISKHLHNIGTSENLIFSGNILQHNIIQQQFFYPTFVFVTFRCDIHRKKIPKKYKEFLFSIINQKTFVGLLAGDQNNALFIIGRQGEDLIFLDPHYVNEAINLENLESFFSYKCNNLCKINFRKLSSTMCLCVLISTYEELIYLENTINKMPKSLRLIEIYENELEINYNNHRKYSEIKEIEDDF